MLMLLLCLGLGMIHITVGILMKAKALIKERKYIDVVFDCGFILCILWGAVAAFAGLGFGMTLVLIGVIGILLTAGRDRKGLHKKLLGGFSSVYGLSGYLSDVLSYSRLFGMGIATGVISMVFNTIGRLLMGNIIGIIFGILVMIIGHTFNIAINTLGAYVHASRLQYIEFYNKFFEGGGRVFVPFAFRTKYIQLIQ
jgi:V/A-type H+-transporting ATPase subunit I